MNSVMFIDDSETFTLNEWTYSHHDVQNFMEYKRLDNEGLYSFRKGIKEQKSTYMEVIVLLKREATPLQIQRILKINPEMLEFFI